MQVDNKVTSSLYQYDTLAYSFWPKTYDHVFTGNAQSNDISGSSLDDDMYGGAGNDTLSGLDGNDRLWGEQGNDYLYGGNGQDILLGGSGNDHLYGGAGNDYLNGGTGNDYLDGGAGIDKAVFSDATAGIDVKFDATKNGVTLNGIENLAGSDYNDIIEGNGVHNVIWGGDGNDLINSRAGDDTLSGGNGNDTLMGGDNDDRLYGDNGNDLLIGGTGDDTMTGGNGDDTFRLDFSIVNGDDIITDFHILDDILQFRDPNDEGLDGISVGGTPHFGDVTLTFNGDTVVLQGVTNQGWNSIEDLQDAGFNIVTM